MRKTLTKCCFLKRSRQRRGFNCTETCGDRKETKTLITEARTLRKTYHTGNRQWKIRAKASISGELEQVWEHKRIKNSDVRGRDAQKTHEIGHFQRKISHGSQWIIGSWVLYMLQMVDDYTKGTWVYLEDEVSGYFSSGHGSSHIQRRRAPRSLNAFAICMTFPSLNGVADRNIHIIMEMAHSTRD